MNSQSFNLRGACFFPILFLFCIVVMSGCGNELGLVDVSGKVTLDGEIVEVVDLSFVPEDGKRSSGGVIDEHGNYRLVFNPRNVGALPGSHTIQIQVMGEVSQAVANRGGHVVLVKKVKVSDENRVIDCELREFNVQK